MKNFSTDEIIILLGAGASCDAGIFNSAQMINQIEKKIDNKIWDKYKGLYLYIKSVHYQQQIFKGFLPMGISFNIENLVSLLDIIIGISKNNVDTYTFVGSWEKNLTQFISEERDNNLISNFKEELIKELSGEWLCPTDWQKKSAYYSKLIDFKKELDGVCLKIFTLNYDLCVEHNLKNEKVENGFDINDDWDFRRYDYNNPNNYIDYYLYKLHGSINWERTTEERLRKKDGDIRTENLAIIFGMNNKLQSYDPYLFYFYEFREHCLQANVIICSGYSFMDEHINDLIKYGLKDNPNKKLVINLLNTREENLEIIKIIAERLKINENQIVLFNKPAEIFFSNDLRVSTFASLFDFDEDNLPANF